MEKVMQRFLLLIFCAISIPKVNAQENVILKKGLMCTQSTLSPSYNFSDKTSYFYLHGSLVGYLNNAVSVSGESYYYLGQLNADSTVFSYNHSMFFGASKHYFKNNNDIYIGLQPGISFTKIKADELNPVKSQLGVNPLCSAVIGYNFYVSNFFHFFIQSRLVIGEHHYSVFQSLSEVRFSAGLGFNLNTMK